MTDEYKLAKLSLQPGDLLVVKCHQNISQQRAERMKDMMERQVPCGVRFVVIDKDWDLGKIEWIAE